MPDIQKTDSQLKPTQNLPTAGQPPAPSSTNQSGIFSQPRFLLIAIGLLALLVWSYAPTLVRIETAWDSNPDYSHGYLVIPLAIFFLYLRRDSAPAWQSLECSWKGLSLLGVAFFIRYLSARLYIIELDSWSMLFWLAGVVWICGGWPLLKWSWPSIAFLVFMLPLPGTVENLISNPLRLIATHMGTWGLQCMAQPAIQEGTTILLGDHILDVERACSGLRMLFGVLALATAYVMIVRPPRWLSIALICSVFPVALLANAIRLVVTGLLFQYASDESAQKFVHDASGWFMIPLAVAMFWGIGWLLTKLTNGILAAPQRGWFQVGKVVVAVILLVVAIFGWHAYQQPRNVTTLLARADAMETAKKYGEASVYLDRYLRLKPGDPEVAARLARTYEHIALDRTSRERLLKLYQTAAQLAPDKLNLQMREAALALELGRPQEVLPLTRSLLGLGSKLTSQERAEVLRIQASATLQVASRLDKETAALRYGEVVLMLNEALTLNPQQLELTLLLASVQLDSLKEPALAERQATADQAFERMLQANPQEPMAWLHASRYWKSRPNPATDDAARADQHLDRAIELNGQQGRTPNLEILLEAGRRSVTQKDFAAAQRFFDTALAKFPSDYRGYADLASLHLSQAEPKSQQLALAILKQGLEKTSQREWRLLLPLAALQVDMGQLTEAQTTFTALQNLLPYFNETARKFLELRLEHLKAASLAKQGKFGVAASMLTAVLETSYVPESASAETIASLRPAIADAWSSLGQYSMRLRAFDQAATAYKNAAQLGGRFEAYVTAANVAEQSGNLAMAAELYEDAIDKTRLPEARIGLARVQLYRQLAAPKANRDWSRFLRTLESAAAAKANPVALVSLKAEYEAANDNPQAAITLLKSLQEQNPEKLGIWEALALAHQRWGTAEDSRQALAEYARLSKDPYQTAMLTSELLSREGNLEGAIEALQKQEKSQDLSLEQKQNLKYRLSVLMVLGKDRANGRRLLETLSAERADDLALLESVARLSLEDQDWAVLKSLESRLHELEGEQGTMWRYFRAHRLLSDTANSSTDRFPLVQSLINELQTLRPQWYKTSELQAISARMQGDLDGAIAALKESLNKGNPNTRVAEEVVSMLIAQGKYDDAQRELNNVRQESANADWLNTVSVPLLIRKGENAQAVKLAESWVQSHPDDAIAYLRLGTSLLTSGSPDDETLKRIEEAFEKALQLAPTDVRTWTMLFSFKMTLIKDQAARKTAVEALVARFAEQKGIEAVQQKVVLAEFQAYLGDSLNAARLFRSACELAEQQPDAQIKALAFARAARFFSTRDEDLAFAYARKLRAATPDTPESSLMLLKLLADRGGAERLKEGFAVLDEIKRQKTMTPALRKMETILLIVRGTPEDRKAAIARLQLEKQSAKGLSIDDQRRLASLYELEGRLLPASELFAEIATRKEATPEQQAYYVSFLQRNAEREPSFQLIANRIMKEMERRPEIAFGAFQLRLSGLIATPAARQQNAKTINDTIRTYAMTQIASNSDAKRQEQLLTNLLMTLMGDDLLSEAEGLALDTEYPFAETTRAVVLANAAAIAGQAGKLSPEAIQFLEQMVGRNPNDAELRFTVGNLYFMKEEYAQAADFYRLALAREPNNALAANNLAMSLTKQNKDLDEAAQLASRAITLGGRQLSFLDTQAAIFSKQGKYGEAAKLLEEVLAARFRIPYALRLTHAYLSAGQTENARNLLEKISAAGGGDPGVLSDDDRQLFEALKKTLSK